MFKGKVQIYTNQNGRENTINKDFNSPEDMQEFLQNNPLAREMNNDFFDSLRSFDRLGEYFDKLIDRKLGISGTGNYDIPRIEQNYWSDIVDLNKYEQEAQKIDYEKKEKHEKTNRLNWIIEKLKSYKEKFKKEWRDDIIKQIDEDMKKVEEELKKTK